MSYSKQQKRKIWEDIKSNYPDIRELIEKLNTEFGPIEMTHYQSKTMENDDE